MILPILALALDRFVLLLCRQLLRVHFGTIAAESGGNGSIETTTFRAFGTKEVEWDNGFDVAIIA